MRLEFLVSFGEPDQSVIRIGWAVDLMYVCMYVCSSAGYISISSQTALYPRLLRVICKGPVSQEA